MDYFYWFLDEPGNRHGIVEANDEDNAREKVFMWLGEIDRDLDTIQIVWVSSTATDVFELDV